MFVTPKPILNSKFQKKYIDEELVSDKEVVSYCINVAVCFAGGGFLG
jgi:hypothetical protein